MGLNREQEEAAHCPGSVAVIAGAGTGKTLMLVERFLYHVLHDGYSPLDVVAVTFTDKAAAELRSRIIREAAGRLDPDRAAELEAAPISTFHTLAARICREHPEEAGAPPEFAVLDEVEGAIWLAERLGDALAVLPPERFRLLPYSLLRQVLGRLLADPLTAKKSLDVGGANGEDLVRHWEDLVRRCREDAFAKLCKDVAWDSAIIALGCYQGPPEDRHEIRRQAAITAMDAITAGLDWQPHFEAIAGLDFRGGSRKKWQEGGHAGYDEVNDALVRIRKRVQEELKDGLLTLKYGPADDLLKKALQDLRCAYEEVRKYLDAAKRETGQLDFSDLEVHALQALRNTEVQQYYKQRWKAFLVDECQDTNPVQAEILGLLAPGAKLTIVGDEKQAIYGFRGCDPAFFRTFREQFTERGDRQVELATSYRTHHPLVEQCNALFESALGDLRQDLSGDRKSACDPYAEHLSAIILDAPKEVKANQRRLAEAAVIARSLKKMLESDAQVFDRASGASRRARPGDIAVLSRKWDTLDAYESALGAAGIPAVHRGGGSLLDTRPAKDAIALLRFLADPGDNISLAAVLRSPFFAVSDTALYQFVLSRQGARGGWWKPLCERPAPGLENACKVLAELAATRRSDPPSRLLQKADRLTGYTAVLANLPGARRRETDWLGMLELVESLERGNQDAFIVCRRLKKVLEAKVEVPRPAVEAGDAVSLLSIHTAKGLEWPIVACVDLCAEGQRTGPRVLMDPELGIALTLDDDAGEKQTPALFQILARQRKDREAAELRRLYYVAITRARDKVILSTSRDKSGAWDFLKPALEHANITIQSEPFQAEDAKYPVQLQPASRSLPPSELFSSMGPGLVEIPVTALGVYSFCPRQFWWRFVNGHPGLGEGSADSRRVGTLTHLALQYRVTDVTRLARFDPGLDAALVQEALDFAVRFRSSDAFAPVRGRVERSEQPITYPLEGLVLHGVADALGSDFVLDYKTDQVMEPEHHSLQLWVYSQAARRQNAWIAYLRQGVLHPYTASDLEDAGQRARQTALDIRAGKFPRSTSVQCQFCPYDRLCLVDPCDEPEDDSSGMPLQISG